MSKYKPTPRTMILTGIMKRYFTDKLLSFDKQYKNAFIISDVRPPSDNFTITVVMTLYGFKTNVNCNLCINLMKIFLERYFALYDIDVSYHIDFTWEVWTERTIVRI